AYIRHRLAVAHWRGDPAVSKAVYPLVYRFSEGVPRRINLICSRLLLHCAVEEKHQVTVSDVREVIQELQSEKLASGDSFSESDFKVEDVFEDVVEDVLEEEIPAVDEADVKALSEDQLDANRTQEAAAQTLVQPRVASATGRTAPVSEARRRVPQKPAAGNVRTLTPQTARSESKKKSPPAPPALKSDWKPINQTNAVTPPDKTKSRRTWSMLTILDASISILFILLIASILVIITSWF
ncbi:MAG: hypothetical protein KDA77_18610, partial [Planctomycetaceae bacterium]|nr:hypothetical protein [Planctomycetaceae bacterium]